MSDRALPAPFLKWAGGKRQLLPAFCNPYLRVSTPIASPSSAAVRCSSRWRAAGRFGGRRSAVPSTWRRHSDRFAEPAWKGTPMRSDENQRLVFEHLLVRFRDQEPFEKTQLQDVTSWTESSFETYWSNQLKRLLVRADSGRDSGFRVGETFRLCSSWERFQKHVTQSRGGSSNYTSLIHAGEIVARASAAEIQQDGARYLVDETTAAVRFIFPCGRPVRREAPLSSDAFAEAVLPHGSAPIDADAIAEASKIRWTFGVLFVQKHLSGRERRGRDLDGRKWNAKPSAHLARRDGGFVG